MRIDTKNKKHGAYSRQSLTKNNDYVCYYVHRYYGFSDSATSFSIVFSTDFSIPSAEEAGITSYSRQKLCYLNISIATNKIQQKEETPVEKSWKH